MTGRIVLYPDPESSEAAGAWERLEDALSTDAPDGAALMRDGNTYAVRRDGRWELTALGRWELPLGDAVLAAARELGRSGPSVVLLGN